MNTFQARPMEGREGGGGEPNYEADIIIHYKDIMKTVISRIFKDKCVYFYQ